jgi:hypothetical protein
LKVADRPAATPKFAAKRAAAFNPTATDESFGVRKLLRLCCAAT